MTDPNTNGVDGVDEPGDDPDRRDRYMTDLEQLTTLLTAWGVPYEAKFDPDWPVRYENGWVVERAPAHRITVEQRADGGEPHLDKVQGYHGFYTLFVFTADGTFKHMGAWE